MDEDRSAENSHGSSPPNDREAIMDRVRQALAPLPRRAEYPEWSPELTVSRKAAVLDGVWERFSHHLRSVNGTPLEDWDQLRAFLKENGVKTACCDPDLQELLAGELGEGIELETRLDRARIDDYQLGITRASGAIAESGTLIFTDRETSDRLAALAPWIHLCLLNPANLYPDVPTALQHLGDDTSIIWATGPSKTADVEGILIEGVHGPGLQAVLMDERVPASRY